MKRRLGKNKAAILEQLKANGSVTTIELASMLDVQPSSIRRTLNGLIETGVVTKRQVIQSEAIARNMAHHAKWYHEYILA